MNQPGSVGPNTQPPIWSFHLEWPDAWGTPATILYACGFRLSFPRAPATEGFVFSPEPGILCGRLPAPMVPSLFCPQTEVQKAGATTWLAAEGSQAVLIQEAIGPEIRFCVAASVRAEPELIEMARRHLARRFETHFENECRRRAAFWAAERNSGLEAAVLHHAIESLFARLRPPEDLMPFRWTAEPTPQGEVFDLRHLYPLVLAWSELEPATAIELVKCALCCQLPDGRLPARAAPTGPDDGGPPALPLIAQAAEQAWVSRREEGFPDFAAPRLRRYLRWACRHYDPEQTGPPHWQSAEEALIPETYDQRLASPDLTAFLLCEIEAYLRLARFCVSTAGDEPAWHAEIQRLKDALHNALWDAPRGIFISRYLQGRSVERLTLSALVPLTVRDLRADQRRQLLDSLHQPAGLLGPTGFQAWIHWEDDAEPPPVRASHQVLLLHALHRVGAEAEAREISQTLLTVLTQRHRELGRLPERLDKTARIEPSGLSDACAAALTVLLASPRHEPPQTLELASPVVEWMDRHRTLLLSGLAGLVMMSLITCAALFLSKSAPPRSTLDACVGLAIRYHQEGRYEEAQALYEKILRSRRHNPLVEILRANTLLKRGQLQDAEAIYRNLIAQPDPQPIAWINLAVTLYLRGQTNEAVRLFREFADRFGERHPQLASRALTAARLLAPDEEAPSSGQP